MVQITVTDGGLRLSVKVQPRSSRNQVCGESDGMLKIKLTAPPVEGEANQALIEFLARQLQITRGQVRLIRGESSRQKLVEIAGLTREQLLERLQIVE